MTEINQIDRLEELMGAVDCGKEDSEFLSYVYGYEHDKTIFNAIKDALLFPRTRT